MSDEPRKLNIGVTVVVKYTEHETSREYQVDRIAEGVASAVQGLFGAHPKHCLWGTIRIEIESERQWEGWNRCKIGAFFQDD